MTGGAKTDAVRGVLWVLTGTFVFSVVFASGKLSGAPVLQIVFIRYLGGLAVMLAAAAMHRDPRLFATPQPFLHGLRALCGIGAVLCTIYAPMHMPIADATAIGLTQGMLVILLAVLFLGERVTGRHWLAALVCTAGALIVARAAADAPSPASTPLLPALVAFLGALLIAIEIILIKVLSARERPFTILIWVNGIATLLLAVPVALTWEPVPTGTLLALGLLGPLAIFGQYCNIRGFRLADASLVGPIGYSWIVFAGLIGFVFFGERPGAATVAGVTLIVAGGIALTRMHARRQAGPVYRPRRESTDSRCAM
jgi:drug/metabolite transporter (DMT)-like permease